MTAFIDKRTGRGNKPAVPEKKDPTVPDALYVEKKEVPREWQEELQRLTPKSEHVSYLWLRWEPGDPWSPVQRWYIWHMRSIDLLMKPKNGRQPSAHYQQVVTELQGPHPRSTGRYDPDYGYWTGGCVGIIDRATWELYQETGHYGTRWWCIQGEHGGHRHRLDAIERRVARIMTGTSDTPIPGELPYAEFDGRVIQKIAQLDKLRAWKGFIDFTKRTNAQMDDEMRQLEQEAQRQIWSWLDGQVDQAVEKIGKAGRKAIAESEYRGLEQSDRDMDYEAIERDFIETPIHAA